ncbi:MAG: sarcosine oxidase subunit gamma [Beijerinckiaceae bacterium]|nr:sarcosine oxidase subunit gamma [Beijerinckiaceae bacterium]
MAEPSSSAAGWRSQSAWAGVAVSGHLGADGGAGVTVCCLRDVGMATLIAPKRREAALIAAVEARYGMRLPEDPRTVENGGVRAVWAGPDQWLLVTADVSGVETLREVIADLGAVSDQTGSRAVLRVSGRAIRAALAKGCMIDLHDGSFPVGAAALSSIAHIGVHLWRLADGPDGAVFEIAAPRSIAGSFWSWFAASAAEFGCAVVVES